MYPISMYGKRICSLNKSCAQFLWFVRLLPFLLEDISYIVWSFFFLLNLFILFIYFWPRWVFVAARGPSPVAESRGHSSLRCAGLSLQWPLPLRSTGSRHVGFSSRGTWAQQLWLTGPVAPRHVGSSQTRARTRVPCISRQILNHCATREAPDILKISGKTTRIQRLLFCLCGFKKLIN